MYPFGRTLAWIYSANRLPVAGVLLNKKKTFTEAEYESKHQL